MPVKASYLMIAGGGAILLWSGFKGKNWSQVLKTMLSGKSPQTTLTAYPIQGGTTSGGINSYQSGGLNVPATQGNVTPRAFYRALRANGVPVAPAITLTAIAGVESGYSTHALNNNPSTGDYSVGLTQINFFGSLYAARVALFGTPQALLNSGLAGQARATAELWRMSGLAPWMPDITSGKINAFLHAARRAAGLS